jgi:dihydroxyacetone kinase DhaKLM complex PTS-EIIA-like component DhaM
LIQPGGSVDTAFFDLIGSPAKITEALMRHSEKAVFLLFMDKGEAELGVVA